MKNPEACSAGTFLLFQRTTVRLAAMGWLVLALILVWLSPGGAAAFQPAEYAANPLLSSRSQGLSITDLQPSQSAQITWDTVLLPNPSPDTLLYSLNAVTAIAPNDIWIVGTANDNATNFLTHALTVHWDGSQWSIIPL